MKVRVSKRLRGGQAQERAVKDRSRKGSRRIHVSVGA